MSNLTSNKTQEQSPISHWKKSEGTFSADAVIDAYLNGVEVGKNKHTKILIDELKANLGESSSAVEEMIEEGNKLKIHVHDVFLKADAITNFTALFIIREEDFVSETSLEIFAIARKIKSGHIREGYYISFLFMPYSLNLKESYLISDGYSWKYE